jgi:DNA mismatch endonuclease, patch repair protein
VGESLSGERRSANMRAIRGRDTTPELRVRRYLHGRGLRYRLDVRALPGRPDLVFPKYRKAVFVHGCFWHQHEDCARAFVPKSNVAFWSKKLARNKERDWQAIRALSARAWTALVVWECQTGSGERLQRLYEEIVSPA